MQCRKAVHDASDSAATFLAENLSRFSVGLTDMYGERQVEFERELDKSSKMLPLRCSGSILVVKIQAGLT